MSHNILTLNNNTFDVNSNRTESISSANFSVVSPTGGGQPANLSVNSSFLYKKDIQINPSTSWVTQIDHATHTGYVEKFRFIQDGTYRVFAKAVSFYTFSNVGTQGYRLYNNTSSQFVSSSFFQGYNDNCYCWNNYMSTIVTRSGADIDISVRCTSIVNQKINHAVSAARYCIFGVEKLYES